MNIEQAKASVITRLGVNYKPERETEIVALLKSNMNIAKGITGRRVLTDYDMECVVNATIMDYHRAGEEGVISRTAIGVNTKYESSYDYLRKTVGSRKSNRRLTGD